MPNWMSKVLISFSICLVIALRQLSSSLVAGTKTEYQRHVLGDVQKLDLTVVDPGLDGELPSIEVTFHEQRILFFRYILDVFDLANHAVPKAARFVESLDVNRVIRVAIEFEQRLVNAFHKAHDVVLFVGFLENPHAYTAQLGAALH